MLTVLHGDCVERMRRLKRASIQLCVTSPPYDNLRTYGGFAWDFEKTALQLYRVLCEGGIVCWNIGDSVVDGSETLTSSKQKIFFHEKAGFRVHQTLIYQKRNFSHPASSRYHSCFEYIFVLSKDAPRVWNPITDRRNLTAGSVGNLGVNTFTEADGSKSEREKKITTEFGKRHDVWLGNTRGQDEMCESLPHPAMMPKWLAHDLILSFSNAGDAVLDPFAGSGTTGAQALELGRKAVLIELKEEYLSAIEKQTDVTPGFASFWTLATSFFSARSVIERC